MAPLMSAARNGVFSLILPQGVQEPDRGRDVLLRPRRERPRRRAAKRDNELPPSDMDCHVTLPWGSCNGGDDITPGSAALRDFKPAHDCSGSIATERSRSHDRACPLRLSK